MRHIFAISSLISLVLALVVGVIWFCSKPDYEPALTSLVLLSAILGLFIDRLVSEKEKRQQLLRSLAHEMHMNAGVAKDIKELKSKVVSNTALFLPRFYTTTLSSVVSSGIFCTKRDAKLFTYMTSWLQRGTEVNTNLSFAENIVSSNPGLNESPFRKVAEGQAFKMALDALVELSEYLLESYSIETGITHETVLFDV